MIDGIAGAITAEDDVLKLSGHFMILEISGRCVSDSGLRELHKK